MLPSAQKRFELLDTLFHEALALPEAERGAYLASHCDDSELRAEIVSMLKMADSDRTDELGKVVGNAAQIVGEDEAEPAKPRYGLLAEGHLIGPYRIVRELGRGGLATVFLAERADAEFQQRVAVKLVRRGMDSDDILQRLRLERQILANLDHPYIARLLDGGTTSDGQPYFVMEAIDGKRLDVWCREHRLELAERLRLFCKICEAVHYAHQNLVLHRDLKPSNILVSGDGNPKLLDFGIAKLLDPADDEGATTHGGPVTETGHRLLTPQYASPEQIRGEALTTASDVYSLGVVLYLLVAGQPPYRVDTQAPPAEIERTICDSIPERPSVVVSNTAAGPPDWRPTGTDDLDVIVAMALRKERARRYVSAIALADDLRRYVENLPVLARPDSMRYRTTKFLRRHRLAVSAAALILVALTSAVVVTTWQARVAREAQGRAEVQRARAEEVASFMQQVFKVSDPYETLGATVTAREILDRSAARIRRELGSSPDLQATLLSTMGKVYQNLSLYPSADELLREALAARERQAGALPSEIAEAQRNLAQLLIDRSSFEPAEKLLRGTLTLLHSFGDAGPEVAATHRQLAEALSGLDRYDEAEAEFAAALQSLGSDEHQHSLERAAVLDSMVSAFLQRGDATHAESLILEVLEIRREQQGENHPEFVDSLNDLAVARRELGDLAGAETLYRQVLAANERLFGERHSKVSTTLHNLAWVRLYQYDLEEAGTLFQRCLDVRRQLYGEQHPAVADALHGLARVEQARARKQQAAQSATSLARAETLARQALELDGRHFGEGHTATLRDLFLLAEILQQGGNPAGEDLYLKIEENLRRTAPGDLRRATALQALGSARCARGAAAEAEPLLREALALLRSSGVPPDHWQLAQTEGELGQCLVALGHSSEARALLGSAIAALETIYPQQKQTRLRQELQKLEQNQ